MPITISSFNTEAIGFSLEQVELFRNADIILCETKDTFDNVMRDLRVDVEDKEIYYTFPTMNSDPVWITEDQLEYFKSVSKTKSIVIVSDDGFPGIADPYSGVINDLARSNIILEIIPNVSSILSAKMLSGVDNDAFVFAGMFTPWDDGIDQIGQRFSEAAKHVAIIFFIVIPNAAFSNFVFNKIGNAFGHNKKATMLFNIGTKDAVTINAEVNQLAEIQQSRPFDPFTLVLHP